MNLPMLDILRFDVCGVKPDGQARSSTIWPLKISSAFWINGSFLKSSLPGGTDPDFAWAGGSAVSLRALAGLSVDVPGGGWFTGPVVGGAGATRFVGKSALTNFTCALGNPNSLSLVWMSVRLLTLSTNSRCSANSGSKP